MQRPYSIQRPKGAFTSVFSQPIFNFQPANSVELVPVRCHQHSVQRAGVRRNQKIVWPNYLANSLKFRANPAIFGVCGHIQCENCQSTEDHLNLRGRFSRFPFCATVAQLGRCYDTDPAVFAPTFAMCFATGPWGLRASAEMMLMSRTYNIVTTRHSRQAEGFHRYLEIHPPGLKDASPPELRAGSFFEPVQ